MPRQSDSLVEAILGRNWTPHQRAWAAVGFSACYLREHAAALLMRYVREDGVPASAAKL